MALGDPNEGVGPYRLVRQIGSGGMGSIFEAVDARLGHRVALKRLHPHVAARPGAADRFLREGRAAARIRHPHVVQVFALGEEGAAPYLAMELLDGRDLAATLAHSKRLGVEDALELLLPVLAAVAAAHDAGVIHRDLKPSNIVVARGPSGRPWPKVVDFGVSKVLGPDGAGASTAADGVVGTAAYMAPEQARSGRGASFHSDQYALAIILYQCLTGGVPFSGASEYEIVLAIMTAPIAPPSERAANLSPLLDAVVLRALHRDPSARYPSVRAFGAALLPFARERDTMAWAAELCDGSSTTPSDIEGPVSSADAMNPSTMPPTARDTRASSAHARRIARGAVAGGVIAAGLAMASGLAWTGRKPIAPAPMTPAVISAPAGSDTAGAKESVSAVSTRDPVPDPATGATAKLPVAEYATESPSPVASSVRSPRRVLRGPAPSARPALPPKPALGDNGAPILP